MHNSLIVSIVFEQLLAKPEKCRMGHAIVFKNNGLFYLFKHPAQSRGWTMPASEVNVRIVFQDFAGPIDALDDSPSRGAFCVLTFMVRPGAVGNNQELFRPCARNLGKNLRR